MPYSMRGLKYVQASRSNVVFPLIVVENDSILELRDGLIRSSRHENNNPDQSKSDDRSDWTLRDRSASFLGAPLGAARESMV